MHWIAIVSTKSQIMTLLSKQGRSQLIYSIELTTEHVWIAQLLSPLIAGSASKTCQHYLETRAANAWDLGLPDAFCKNTGHFVNSTRPSTRSKLCRKSLAAQGKQRDNEHCYFSVFWLAHYISVCVCDVKIARRIASRAANKLRWRNCSDKIHY